MRDPLRRVTQHLAVWDPHRDAGWVVDGRDGIGG
jgi:hypothetical protein